MGDKLNLPGGALTFKDVRKPLSNRAVDSSLLGELEDIIRRCEAGRYAGHDAPEEIGELTERGLSLGSKLERLLK